MMYDNGEGVLQNHVEAYKWFNLATTYADASIQETSAKQRDSVAERLTPEQRAEGQRLSREWFAAHPQQEPSPAEVADVRARAYPWSRLMLARRSIPADLNVQLPHRVSGLLVWVVIFGAVALPLSAARVWQVVFSLTAGAGAVSIIWLNWRFYRFLTTCREPWFTVRAVWIHLLYYAYSSATFGWAWVRHRVASVFDDLRLRPVSRARPHP
jgi:hypothetical protein